MKKGTVIYLAGAYTGKTAQHTLENIYNARRIAVELWEQGYYVVCPHTNTSSFELEPTLANVDWYKAYLEIQKKCDVVVLIKGWQNSEGAVKEYEQALKYDQPVYFYINGKLLSKDEFVIKIKEGNSNGEV